MQSRCGFKRMCAEAREESASKQHNGVTSIVRHVVQVSSSQAFSGFVLSDDAMEKRQWN